MAKYIDLQYLKDNGNFDPADIDQMEEANPGRIDAVISAQSRVADGILGKRYATPFDADAVPEQIKWAVAAMVSMQLLRQRGTDPSGDMFTTFKDAKDEAMLYLRGAGDAKEGFVELPLREDPTKKDATGIRRSGPIGGSYASPYAWADMQAARLRNGGR